MFFLWRWMMRLLWGWRRGGSHVFGGVSFVTGEFLESLADVMLAPGVFYLILSGSEGAFGWEAVFGSVVVFCDCLFWFTCYLPIRTWAGAAMHWGDPDTWIGFWEHVSGRFTVGGMFSI